MKYKALLLSLLLLLPLAAFAVPVNADINGPVLWVNPVDIHKEGPCLVSSTFDIEVKLWNKKDLTGVGIYAFDFTLDWDVTDIISLMSVSFVAPWDHYYVIVDEIDEVTGMYHLAITALDGSDPLEEVQIVLATLTFHIDCEPLYPDEYTTTFDLEATLSDMVDGKPVEVIPHEVDDGTFTLTVAQPDVEIAPAEICEYKVGMLHTIEFWLSNINQVYGFGFVITWNPLYLKGDIQTVDFCDAFPPPYEYLYMYVDNDAGYIYVEMVRPCEKPTVTHQEGPAATFVLESIYDFPETDIPLCADIEIVLEAAFVYAKTECGNGADVMYYIGDGLLVTNDVIDYLWRPRIGDLNLDGAVDIQDLDLLAGEFGNDLGVGGWGALDEMDTTVNIFDFVVVAKYFGKPYECDPTGESCWPDP